MSLKAKFLLIVILVCGSIGVIFLQFPRIASLALSFKRQCKVLRVEPFMTGLIVNGQSQGQKFSVVCDDGEVCRAEDTGFAGVKEGDFIEYRGFPEFGSFEEWGKCDHAQLLRIIPKK